MIPIFVLLESKKERSSSAGMYKIEKAAKITMVKNIFGCPSLVVDVIFVPNSYVDFMFLCIV